MYRKILVLILILLLLFTIDFLYFENRIYHGITIENINIGGKTVSEVEKILEEITVDFIGPEGNTHSVSLEDIGINLDKSSTIKKTYEVGRTSIYPINLLQRINILFSGHNINFVFGFDEDTLENNLENLTKKMSKEPKNARFETEGKDLNIISSKPGYNTNKEKLRDTIKNEILNDELKFNVFLPYRLVTPEVTTKDLKKQGITNNISSFCTEFDAENKDRKHNIELASDMLDQLTISPKEYFSFNDYIGDTTEEKGYKKAPIMIGGQLDYGVGGGICQVSSTLYNAFLKADIEIVERNRHQMLVDYIEPGRDATISYGSLDLVAKNDNEHHILIGSEVTNGRLCMHIFGKPIDKDIKINTKILETYPFPVEYHIDNELVAGEEKIVQSGVNGHLVKVEKLVNGTSKTLSIDRYEPMKEIIHTGPDE
ncbi:VanW family protein [Natranaerobius trueperi]|uniref:G5 domain-containing protein n=1 Tax=Natranaerobius trueperi TaxID=759412 RepID=A0A226BXG6_9FIRM|nr:VanW family protein [Natranaerobius trueperi]OWZ82840.1 hypothetical protein CDO51_11950 [Natranaerobius trueperi]